MSNGNQSAFPVPAYVDAEGYTVPPVAGMSKREYFAGLAMQGLLAGRTDVSDEAMASYALRAADALLATLDGAK